MSGWRLALVWFALITFGLQSYVTQTHIHFAPDGVAAGIDWDGLSLVHAKHNSSPDKSPANDDPANCPICQDMAIVGHFVTPAVAILPLPSQLVSCVAICFVEPRFISAVSHSWQGRAPPAH